MSVIEYQGSLASSGESRGHYICDVKDKSSGHWYRTNDNCNPRPIDVDEVSKCAYVVLYKKMLD